MVAIIKYFEKNYSSQINRMQIENVMKELVGWFVCLVLCILILTCRLTVAGHQWLMPTNINFYIFQFCYSFQFESVFFNTNHFSSVSVLQISSVSVTVLVKLLKLQISSVSVTALVKRLKFFSVSVNWNITVENVAHKHNSIDYIM